MYTSKTRSWDGGIKSNLGGVMVIRDESGFGMNRDVNGARGIFLWALRDSPILRGLLTQVAAQQTNVSSIVCWQKSIGCLFESEPYRLVG